MHDELPLIVANLKANQTSNLVADWLGAVGKVAQTFKGTIVFCPSHPFLTQTKEKILNENLKIKLGCQDISKFNQGPYTGEFTATQIKDICQFAIVGHSERRKHFAETDDDVIKKVELLIQNQVIPILCISDFDQLESYEQKGDVIKKNSKKIIFVYEPPSAISSQKDYKPEDPGVASVNAKKIHEKIGSEIVTIYGGSINAENVNGFLEKENIQGGLVGQASINPDDFIQILSALS